MRALTTRRWGGDVTPWQEFEALSERIRRWADFPPLGASLFRAPLLTETTEWLPAVELVENDGEFLLTAEIPGMAREDVDISVEDNVLTLKGEKKLERDEKKEEMHIREREYGTFTRAFTLPRNVDAAKIRAEYHDGIVEIHMPKGLEAKGRQIEIT
ncbi:MAG: Hsp20/alpha crystallin family protein [Gemmatimonadales bacterium]